MDARWSGSEPCSAGNLVVGGGLAPVKAFVETWYQPWVNTEPDFMRGLDDMTKRGSDLKNLARLGSPLEYSMAYSGWVSVVGEWVSEMFPDSGLRSDWASLPSSDLGTLIDKPTPFARGLAEMHIDQRLRWLANLPSIVALRRLSTPEMVSQNSLQAGRKELKLALTSRAYVDPARIQDLQNTANPNFDLSKLVRLCQEINLAFATESYFAMAMLTRAIIDHVPPIFGMKSFAEVANNYASSTSVKKELKNLETTLRNIADLHLHSHIRRKEALPTITQVDVSNSLDLLLSEIVVALHNQENQ